MITYCICKIIAPTRLKHTSNAPSLDWGEAKDTKKVPRKTNGLLFAKYTYKSTQKVAKITAQADNIASEGI